MHDEESKINPYVVEHSANVATEKQVVVVQTESHLRSAMKALSWRVVATATTTTIAFVMTGQIGTALRIGGIEFFLKFFIYYGHERVWQLVPRGTVRKIYESAG